MSVHDVTCKALHSRPIDTVEMHGNATRIVERHGDVETFFRHVDADPVERLRRAQTALDVSEHIPEGAYLQTMNALGEAHRSVRPRRDDD